MSLTRYYHPLSSFCQKVLTALYESDTPFKPYFVDFTDTDARKAFLEIWPVGQFPVLHDEKGDRTIPESSIIIEYLAQHYPGKTKLLPDDPDLARQTRFRERFFDLHVAVQMQKIVTDRFRPKGQNDTYGVDQAKTRLKTALDMIESDIGKRTWAMGDAFSMADCAAAPALSFANLVMPFAQTHKATAAYLDRLTSRPSYARALKEAQPYFAMVPKA